MKVTIKISLVFISLLFISFKGNNEIIPTGTKEVNGIYIDKSAVTLIDYKEFIVFIEKDDMFSLEYALDLMPDTAINEFFMGVYKKAHVKNPILGLTKYQASEFCRWRSEMVTFVINFPELLPDCNKKGCAIPPTYAEILEQNKEAKTTVIFRIPTDDELIKTKVGRKEKSLKILTIDKEKNKNLGLLCVAEVVHKQ